LRPLVGLAAGFVVLRTVVAGSVLLLAVIGVISLVCLAIHSAVIRQNSGRPASLL